MNDAASSNAHSIDPQKSALIRSHARWRWIFLALGVLVPLGPHILFERQASRLEALADHGVPTTAIVTRITTTDSDTYVSYEYAVSDRKHSWTISQQNPPLRVGDALIVRFLPESPEFNRPGADGPAAREEAASNRRTTRKVLLGVFAFFAVNSLTSEIKRRGLQKTSQQTSTFVLSPAWMGRAIALLILALILASNLSPEVAAVEVKAVGQAPLGLPPLLFVTLLQLVLYLPFFWIFEHAARIAVIAMSDRSRFAESILQVHKQYPELARSRIIVFAGLGYFIVLMAAWITYAEFIGL